MKNTYLLYSLVSIFVFLYSCGTADVRFSEPQPNKARSLPTIPKKLQGKYKPKNDSAMLFNLSELAPRFHKKELVFALNNQLEIKETCMLNHISGTINFHINILDDTLLQKQFPKATVLKGLLDKTYMRPEYIYRLNYVKDSVMYFNFKLTDTLFLVAEDNVIKRFKGKYYLNLQQSNIDKEAVSPWQLHQLALMEKDTLTISTINKKDETVLRRILELNEEVYQPDILSPSKKSFKEFLKMKGFSHQISLVRIKENNE